MDIDRIRYFQALNETGNLRKAAELLHISPAALSKAMRILAEETQLKLFIPEGRGIIITDKGRAFAERSRPLLQEYERLLKNHREEAPQIKKLRIASFEVFTTHLMGPLIRDYFRNYEVSLYELVPGQIEDAVLNGRVDFGITYIPLPQGSLDFVKILDLEMGLYWRDGAFDRKDFAQIPFAAPVTPIEGSPTKVQGLDGWPDDRVPRFIPFRFTMLESALELCRQGLAAGYFPKFVVDLHNATVKTAFQLKLQKLPSAKIDPLQSVYVVKRKAVLENTEMRLLAKGLRTLCR
jgi:DNA-binding transcriptional LysR family regulator